MSWKGHPQDGWFVPVTDEFIQEYLDDFWKQYSADLEEDEKVLDDPAEKFNLIHEWLNDHVIWEEEEITITIPDPKLDGETITITLDLFKPDGDTDAYDLEYDQLYMRFEEDDLYIREPTEFLNALDQANLSPDYARFVVYG